MPKIDFTDAELGALVKLIDSGVKHDGLPSARNAVLLMQKIEKADMPPPTKP